MFGFGKKKNPDVGAATDEQFVVPVDLNEAHSYVRPGASEYPSPPTYGANVFASSVGKELPTIKNQDAILVHYMQPAPNRNPQEWYDDRNAEKLRLGRSQELFQTNLVQEHQASQGDAVNPWHSTPDNPRVTGHVSPSNYRFIRPFDQRWERTGNGVSGSMASLGRSYPVGGMQAPRNFRNTFRIEPTARDAENYDLSGTSTYAPTPAVYVSPQVQSNAESRWRL